MHVSVPVSTIIYGSLVEWHCAVLTDVPEIPLSAHRELPGTVAACTLVLLKTNQFDEARPEIFLLSPRHKNYKDGMLMPYETYAVCFHSVL
jgi:hypothetical protein